MSDLNKHSNTSEQSSTAKQRRGPIRWILTIIALLLISVIAVLIILIITPVGRGFVTQQVLNRVTLPDGMDMRVEGMQSPTLGNWSVSKLLIEREQQSMLAVENFEFKFALFELMKGQLHVPILAANSIELWPERFPKGEPKPEISAQEQLVQLEKTIKTITNQLQKAALPIVLDELRVNKLRVNGENPIELGLNGQLRAASGDNLAQASLNIDMQEGPLEALTTSLRYDRQQQLHLTVQANSKPATSKNKQANEPDTEQAKAPRWQTDTNIVIDLSQSPYALTIDNSDIKINDETLNLQGLAKVVPGKATIDSINIKGLGGLVELSGEASPAELALTLDIVQLELARLLPQVEALTLSGKTITSGPVDQLNVDGYLSGTGKVEGQNIFLNTDFKADATQVELSDFQAQAGDAQLIASGTYTIKTQAVAAKVQARQLTTELAQQFGIEIPPDISATLEQADANLNARLPSDTQELSYDFDGKASASATVQALPIELDATFKGDHKKLSVDGTQINVNKTPINIAGSVNTEQSTLDLRVSSDSITPATLKGLDFTLPATADFNQTLLLKVTGPFKSPQVAVDTKGSLGFEQLRLFNQCSVQASPQQIDIQKCAFFETKAMQKAIMNHIGRIKLQPLNVDIKHRFDQLVIGKLLKALPKTTRDKVKASELQVAITGDARSQVSQVGESIKIDKISTDLKLSGQTYQQPIKGNIKLQAQNLTDKLELALQQLSLSYGKKSRFDLSGNYNAAKIAMELKTSIDSQDLTKLPLPSMAALNEMPSVFKLDTAIKGKSLDPTVMGKLSYQIEVDQLAQSGELDSIPFEIKASIDRQQGKMLKLNGDIRQAKQVESTFKLETNGLSQVLGQMQQQKPVKPLFVQTEGELDLDNLNILISPIVHEFSGKTRWQARFDDGKADGKIQISDGSYQHLTMGTHLTNIELNAEFDPKGLRVTKGSARDPKKGKYAVSGYVQSPLELSDKSKLTNLRVQLTNAQLLERPDVELQAGGLIEVLGAQVEGKPGYKIKGRLDIQPLAIKLDQAQASGIPELNVEYVKVNKATDPAEKSASVMPPIALDIVFNTEQQAYLRGKGIDTELAGKIKVLGTAEKPQIDGFFKTLRGEADILGKRFTIETGELRLSDAQGILNLEAVHTNKDQRFIAKVTGSLQSPEVRLTSDPPLPEDETVSRLLFGKALSDVTAMQALRIAAAVRSLGSSGGLDPIGSTRDLLGVDQVSLENETDDSGNSNYKVGVGKYVSERVYVEIERSSDATDPWQGRVEVDITDSISLETSAQSDTGVSGIDLNWKRDY